MGDEVLSRLTSASGEFLRYYRERIWALSIEARAEWSRHIDPLPGGR